MEGSKKASAGKGTGRRRASILLAIVGALLALVGGLLLYASEVIFEPDELAQRAESAMGDERVRLAIAQPIVDGIIDSGNGALVNARPVIESLTVSILNTAPAKAAVGDAVKSVDAALAGRNTSTLLLDLGQAASIAAQALDALAPRLGDKLPREIDEIKTAILDSEITITPVSFARSITALGIVLPFLALLAFAGSVAVSTDRRYAVQRCAGILAGAAVVTFALLLIGEAIALGQVSDPIVKDALSAIWESVFGTLQSWTLGVGLISLILAAAVRFGASEVDPLEPLVKAEKLIRFHPARTWLRLVRGLGLGFVGVFVILEPSLALRLIAITVGSWLIYVAIVELLGVIAPVVEGADSRSARGGGPRRRISAPRAAVFTGLLAAVVVMIVLVSGGSSQRPAGPPEACNGYAELCDKRLDELTIPATHNSMSAAAEPGWYAPNQRYGIERQLDDGIRGLLIDTHYGFPRGTSNRDFGSVITDLDKENKTRAMVEKEIGSDAFAEVEALVGRIAFGDNAPTGQSEAYLCHVLCELGATRFDVALKNLYTWMEGHPDEFVVVFIEDVVSPEETAAAFEKSGLLRWAHVPARDEVGPTLGELIEEDERLLIMAENDAGDGAYPWYVDGFDYLVQETPYTFDSVPEIEARSSCRQNRGKATNPLFQINHWIEKIPRSPSTAARINAPKFLGERSRMCERIRGLQPNLLAVDYYNEGDVFAVANEFNGVPPDAETSVRQTG